MEQTIFNIHQLKEGEYLKMISMVHFTASHGYTTNKQRVERC